MKKSNVIFLPLMLLSGISCTDNLEDIHPELSIIAADSQTVIEGNGSDVATIIPSLGGSAELTVKTESAWDYLQDAEEDWYAVEMNGDGLKISAEEFVSDYERTALLRIVSDGHVLGTVKVKQFGTETASLELDWNELVFSEKGGTTEVTVTTNRDSWEVSGYEDARWMEVERNESGFTVSVTRNEVAMPFETVLVVRAGSEKNHAEFSLPVTLKEWTPAYIRMSQDDIIMPAGEGKAVVGIESNRDWKASSDADWLRVSCEKDRLIMEAGAAVSDINEAEVLLETCSGKDYARAVIRISQFTDPMILEYSIPRGDVEVAVPLAGNVNCYIEWGDGETYNFAGTLGDYEYITHTYSAPGNYEVSIYGEADGICCGRGVPMATSRQYITEITTWGAMRPKSMRYGLACTSVKSLPEDTREAFANVETFYCAFQSCALLESIPEDIFHDSRAAEYTGAFWNCTALKEIPENLFMNSPSDISLNSCFRECVSLKSIPERLFYPLKDIKAMVAVFDNCTSIESLPEKLLANNGELGNILAMFRGCSGLKEIPAGIFDANRKLENVSETFAGCTSVRGESPYTMTDGGKVRLWERESHPDVFKSVTSFYLCFEGCRTLDDFGEMPEDWKIE